MTTDRLCLFVLLPPTATEEDAANVAAVWAAGFSERVKAPELLAAFASVQRAELDSWVRVRRVNKADEGTWKTFVEKVRAAGRPIDQGALSRTIESAPLAPHLLSVVSHFLDPTTERIFDRETGNVVLRRVLWKGSWIALLESDIPDVRTDHQTSGDPR